MTTPPKIPFYLFLLLQSTLAYQSSIITTSASIFRSLQGFGVGGNLETASPTASPTIDTVGTVAPKDSWDARNITFLYQLWTTKRLRSLDFGVGGNLESANNDETSAVLVVQKAYREALRKLVLEIDAPVTIKRLESTAQGT